MAIAPCPPDADFMSCWRQHSRPAQRAASQSQGNVPSNDIMQISAALQAARVEALVVMLNALLRRWVEGDEQGFKVCNT